MIKLSVNINKIATIRNARGGSMPDVVIAARAIENFGAHGITIHPRPDQRHITKQDVYDLKKAVKTEFNIEGFPSDDFVKMIHEVKPDQVTLVPDSPDVLTSNAGWDCKVNQHFLTDVVTSIKETGARVSLFLDPKPDQIEAAKRSGADRIELYTEAYAIDFPNNPTEAIQPYVLTAMEAGRVDLGVNAGHDLSLSNLAYFVEHVPNLLEVSIGHALISDALYYGLNNTVQLYLAELQSG